LTFPLLEGLSSVLSEVNLRKIIMTTTVLSLQGLSCGHCVASTRKALEAVEGTTAVEVSLDKAIVKGDASSQSLVDAVVNAGYEAQVVGDTSCALGGIL